MPVGIVRISLAHDDENFATWASCAGTPPLASVQYVLVALAPDGKLDIGSIGACHIRFGHGKGRAYLAIEQGLQPLSFLLRRAKFCQYLHIAGIGRGAVKDLRGPADTAHDLGQRRVLQVRQTGPVLFIWQKEIPQSLGLGNSLEFIDDLRMVMGITTAFNLLAVCLLVGINITVHELAHTDTQRIDLLRIGKIHSIPPMVDKTLLLFLTISHFSGRDLAIGNPIPTGYIMGCDSQP